MSGPYRYALAIASCFTLAFPAFAQEAAAECDDDGATEAATPPAAGAESGTEPGGMGSTAWSGGTGGSFIDTGQEGEADDPASDQPETAEGLDPTAPPTAADEPATAATRC